MVTTSSGRSRTPRDLEIEVPFVQNGAPSRKGREHHHDHFIHQASRRGGARHRCRRLGSGVGSGGHANGSSILNAHGAVITTQYSTNAFPVPASASGNYQPHLESVT